MKLTNVVLPALLVVLLCLVTTVALRRSKILNDSRPAANEVVVAQGASERGPVRMIRFVLLENALYPRQMRVNQGLINLSVEDETGVSEGLVVVKSNGERISTVRRQVNGKRGRELVRLTPGVYVVYDVSKPNNKAELIVEP